MNRALKLSVAVVLALAFGLMALHVYRYERAMACVQRLGSSDQYITSYPVLYLDMALNQIYCGRLCNCLKRTSIHLENVRDDEMRIIGQGLNPHSVSLKNPRLSDEVMASIRCSSLSGDIPMTDRLAGEFRRHSRVESLSINVSAMTVVGMRDLAAMRSLKSFDIDMDQSEFDDEWMQAMASNRNLEFFHFYAVRCKVTDAGVHALASHPSLRILSPIGELHLSDAGFHDLANMPALAELSICDEDVTDRALGILSTSRTLESLDIGLNTSTTDAGLLALKGCKSLQRLQLDEFAHTTAGAKALLRLSPHLKIQFGNAPVSLP